jgi:hypothetical protein
MDIHEVQEAISAFITMVYDRDAISEEELVEIERAESALIHYIAEKEND